MNIDWSIFWQAVGSIATSAAVIVALWQTQYLNRKKVKLQYYISHSYKSAVPSDSSKNLEEIAYITVDAINAGARKVVITQFGVEIARRLHYILNNQLENEYNWPIEVAPEQFASFIWSEENFKYWLRNPIDSEEIVARKSQFRKVSFYIKDSTGRIYVCKTKKTIRQYLAEYKIIPNK